MVSPQWFDVQSALAQQENLEAIALLLNRALPPSITTRVARKQTKFGVLLESVTVPDRDLAYGVSALRQIQGIQTLRVYGRKQGQSDPDWCIVFPVAPSNQQRLYGYFVTEAQELLEDLEQTLLNFQHDHSPNKIHSMFLAAHTIKGGSASIGLHTIAKVAHGLEDVFAALRHVEAIDNELVALLIQGYESLKLPLMAEFSGVPLEESEVLNQSASVIVQIQERLGDCFERETPILTSAELGFDIVHNLFQVGVAQRLGDLERSLLNPDSQALTGLLHDKAEFFLGVAESTNLPGLKVIAQTVLQALTANPDRVIEIAELALADFSQGRVAVLAGDREQGGTPSLKLTGLSQSFIALSPWVEEPLPDKNPMNWTEDLSLDDLFGNYPT
jgi:two-component system, chemotaxis family, sensor histidine kinase and response regulator PixL